MTQLVRVQGILRWPVALSLLAALVLGVGVTSADDTAVAGSTIVVKVGSFRNRTGTYGISVMHDENNSKKLDKNVFGVPTEGYGVSNNHTHALRTPTWEESKFRVEQGKNL